MTFHHYTRSVKPSSACYWFCSLVIRHCPKTSLLPKLKFVVFYQVADAKSSFSPTILSNMLLMLNFMKGKKVQIFQSKFYLQVAKTVNNFCPLSYFCSTWTYPTRK